MSDTNSLRLLPGQNHATYKMKVSIIIVSWNVREDLVRCLRSIEKYRPSRPYEVIVVDNGSSDGTAEFVERDFPTVTVIANEHNRGFAAANNQGFQKAKGQYILLLNPDTIVHKGSLDALIDFMDNNSDVGACGPKLLNADGTTQASLRQLPTFRGVLYRYTICRNLRIFRKQYESWMMKDFGYDKQAEVEQLMGSALLVRRLAMEQVGTMDERFFMYYEEVDLCYRLRQGRWRITFVPEATITHLGGRSAEQLSVTRRAMMFASMFAFFRKHRGAFRTVLFGIIFKAGVFLAELCKLTAGLSTYLYALAIGDKNRKDKSLARIKNATAWLAGTYRKRVRKPLLCRNRESDSKDFPRKTLEATDGN
jgi:GT2 family glycosyltransferase